MQKQLMKQKSNLRKMFERKKSRLKTFQLSRLRRKLRIPQCSKDKSNNQEEERVSPSQTVL
ncbi:hypothetical protein HanXRQr2_Chr09g0398461 [Helianthus annuus]|uniref:Uncharacterized protein n=1 Tax=Helianthus annuus TaxID=4232 RepID=A0A251TYR9_HELAN|nr:hypothetical protein HanXRQr2_Chr09g0398461 [Helianthus annuus]KAJ0894008.1 hypothetical protein HanPSC8_Chr09g0384221 [Helianthus annuus]